MRSRTPDDFAGMCRHCYLKTAYCICAWLPVVETQIEILIIRHATEARMTSNTGRLAALLLPNCRLLEFTAGNELPEGERLDDGNTWLLYPGSNPKPTLPTPRRLVVLDASFRRAKRMYKRIDTLRALPELALPPPTIIPHRLRQPPRADGMSTIEAIAAGLSSLEEPALGSTLLDAYAEFVRRADLAHGRVRTQ